MKGSLWPASIWGLFLLLSLVYLGWSLRRLLGWGVEARIRRLALAWLPVVVLFHASWAILICLQPWAAQPLLFILYLVSLPALFRLLQNAWQAGRMPSDMLDACRSRVGWMSRYLHRLVRKVFSRQGSSPVPGTLPYREKS